MTNPPTMSCLQVETLAPELALGALDGNERAATLVHLESCTRCRQLVEDLAEVADDLLLLAPEAEPPLGFESRAATRIAAAASAGAPVASGAAASGAATGSAVRAPVDGETGAEAGMGVPGVDPVDRRGDRRRRTRRRTTDGRSIAGNAGHRTGRQRLVLVAAAAFLVGALGAGAATWAVANHDNSGTSAGPVVRLASVNAAGGTYTCRAVAVGSQPVWLYLSVDQPGTHDGQYRVEAVTSGTGKATWAVGTVIVTNGHGTLAVPLDLVSGDLRSLRILDAGGQVRYEAPFSAGGTSTSRTSIA